MAVEAFRSRIGSALANRDYAEVEAAWRECSSLHPEEYDYLITIAAQLARHDKGPLAGELCLGLAQALLETDPTRAFAAARASLKASQRTENLRELLALVYTAKYPANPDLESFFEKSGLSGDGGGR